MADTVRTDCIVVINAGSSSIKFAVHAAQPPFASITSGQIEGIGTSPHLSVRSSDGKKIERRWPVDGFDHRAAIREMLALGPELTSGIRIVAAGHRVVHGGTHFDGPVLIDDRILDELATLEPLAPLHQPHNLAAIRVLREIAPEVPQVACFDTAFHRAQPPIAQAFALPRALSDSGIRRYGFHGLSYEYIARRLPQLDPAFETQRVIVAHLGNGASLCAMQSGRSVASTMGFTAVDGLVMGTRCGSIDPGVLLYLMDTHGMDARALEGLIYRESGLLGVSGISSDMRTLRTSSDPRAREAIDLFVYRIVREIGSLTAALGGLDAIVFTAGIGEHDVATRSEVCAATRWLGASLDDAANRAGDGRISARDSAVSVWVVPTDEEAMIALHTASVVTPIGSPSS
jgi:acetate kinase